ncbi:MAG TPA: serine/threonine-protein kinase [Planctomycetota bacterium]
MSEPLPKVESVGPEPAADAADLRMVEVLRGSSTGADLRAELQGDATAEGTDLLSRLNALEFVQQLVGGAGDVPTRIGDYQVKGVLGRGGMGTVYLGWQEELEREVALKVLAPNYASDPTMRKRFRAEARATAALHHQHIVPIYDYGEAQGMLFFAMERVDGMSLDKHIAAARRLGKRPMEPLDAAQRFAGVADALGLAHRRRVLHRDVKPGNILVASDGTLALSDFGLAKALDHASVRLTSKGGGFLGTLHYSSPEQALGRETTQASDLYSLGVTIFEAVTGELPLAGKTTEALLQSILHGTPTRLRDVVRDAPRDLDAVLEKLLSREPADRYQDGEELARDLQRIADGEPVHIKRLPLHVRVWRRARKNPVLSGAIIATFVLSLATVTLLTVWRRERGQSLELRHQDRLVDIVREISGEAGSPWGPAHVLYSLCGAVVPTVPPSVNVLQELERARHEWSDDAEVEAIHRAYVDDPEPEASALLRTGRGYEALLRYDTAIADALAARTGGELAVELRLYGLYLGRGVANLTAAVARTNEARMDLALAAFLRPGAVFPRALQSVLDVAQSADVPTAARQLEIKLANAAPERVRAIGLLLWGFAGLQPPRHGNLMEFGLRFQGRRAVHEVAARLLQTPPADLLPRGTPTGLSGEIADLARDALLRLNEPAVMRDLIGSCREGIEQRVHPESPLQGWWSVLSVLEQPTHQGGLLDRNGNPLSPALELATWDDLLRLSPKREKLKLWLPRFETLRRNHPGLRGMLRVAARMHLMAGSPDADKWIREWIVEAEGDPEALLCRMRLLLREGKLEEARDDAIVAVQESVARAETLRDVVSIWDESQGELGAGDVEDARIIARQFRALEVDNGAAEGSGR